MKNSKVGGYSTTEQKGCIADLSDVDMFKAFETLMLSQLPHMRDPGSVNLFTVSPQGVGG